MNEKQRTKFDYCKAHSQTAHNRVVPKQLNDGQRTPKHIKNMYLLIVIFSAPEISLQLSQISLKNYFSKEIEQDFALMDFSWGRIKKIWPKINDNKRIVALKVKLHAGCLIQDRLRAKWGALRPAINTYPTHYLVLNALQAHYYCVQFHVTFLMNSYSSTLMDIPES